MSRLGVESSTSSIGLGLVFKRVWVEGDRPGSGKVTWLVDC